MKRCRSAVLAAMSVLTVAGCSYRTVGEAERAYAAREQDANAYLQKSRQPLPAAKVSPVKVVNSVFTSGSARRALHGEPLPRKFETAGVVVVRPAPIELFEIGTAITEATGIPVTFAADVFGDEKAEEEAKSGADSQETVGVPGIQAGSWGELGSLLKNMNASGNTAGAKGGKLSAVTGTRGKMKVSHSGKLSSLLDLVGSYYGVNWEYSGGSIQIHRNVFRTFTLNALPLSVQVSNSMDSGSNSSAGGSGSGSGSAGDSTGSSTSSKSDVTIKIWEEITKAIEGLVGTSGQVTASISTGTISVSAPAPVMARVQAYLEGQNARMSHQVAISVQVLSVSLSEGDNFNFDLQGMLASGMGNLAFGNAGSGVGAVATALTGGTGGLNFGIVDAGSRLNGTNAVVEALSTKGRVSIVTTASLTTLNGIPAPLQVANSRNYLERMSVTQNETGGTQVELTPGNVTTGFNMSVLPRVLDDGSQMLLQFGINMSELIGKIDGFDQFTSNGSTIQLPNKNTRNFVQQAKVPNGATLVLAGFEQMNDTASKQGTGSPDFFLLGGGQTGQRQRDVIVILITPVLLDNEVPAITMN